MITDLEGLAFTIESASEGDIRELELTADEVEIVAVALRELSSRIAAVANVERSPARQRQRLQDELKRIIEIAPRTR